MKLTKTIVAACGILAILVIASCTKNVQQKLPETSDFTNTALVQMYNGIINSNRNYIYVDGKPVNGATIAYGSSFPTSYNFGVAAGPRPFVIKDTLVTSTQQQLAFTSLFNSAKTYTIFTYDTITSPKVLIVPTTIEIPRDTTARVRFANFVWWKTGTPSAVDIFSKKRNANIFTNIAPTQVTEFIPYASASSDSLIVRNTGTMVALDTATFTFTQRRSYTLVFRGRYANNEAGGATFPRTLSSFINY
jgi:hypothetical protein